MSSFQLPIKVLCVNRAIAQRIVDLDRARAARDEQAR